MSQTNRDAIRDCGPGPNGYCRLHRDQPITAIRGYLTNKKRLDSWAWYPACDICVKTLLASGARDERAQAKA